MAFKTWNMFLNLVKAFDRVPRELLWGVLRNFRIKKLVRLLIAPHHHKHVEVQFTVSGIIGFVEIIIGVKQRNF